MVVTQSQSSPLFVVLGATGSQGGSVVTALRDSSKSYRVRAITRDTTKPAAKDLASHGVEVVEADIATPEGAAKAFKGADIVFTMTLTDYFAPDLRAKEIAEGRTLIDAAKAAGAKTFVWAGLPSLNALSGGNFPVLSFDTKAEITAYARSVGGLKVYDAQPGNFASNYLSWFAPRKQENGSYVLALPLPPNAPFPIIDTVADYGKFVVGAVENGGLEEVRASVEYITGSDIAKAFENALGKPVHYVEMPYEQFYTIIKGAMNEQAATIIVQMYKAFKNTGYYGGADLTESNKILSTRARTFVEFLEANKEQVLKTLA